MKYNDFKNYGLTSQPGEGVQDKIPEWLDDFISKSGTMTKKASKKNKFIFAGIDDPILNPNRIGLEDGDE